VLPEPYAFLDLLVRPPGNLIYFVLIMVISQASLFMAMGERWRLPSDPTARRYSLATTGLVIIWFVVMVGALIALLTNQSAVAILPPLERAATSLSIVLLTWAFLSPESTGRSTLINSSVLLLMVAIVIGYLLTGVDWGGVAQQLEFNSTPYAVTWAAIPFALSILSIFALIAYFRRIPDAPLKLIFFTLLAIGFGVTMFRLAQGFAAGHDPGPARLAFLAALPLLPAILYRSTLARMQHEISTKARQVTAAPAPAIAPAPVTPIERPLVTPPPTSISPMQRDSIQLLRTLGLIMEEATPTSIPERIVKSALESLKAEAGALFTLQDANYADIVAGYDRVAEKPLSGLALNLDSQPTLVNTVERRLQRPLFPDRNADELRDIYNRLDIEQVGPAYLQPLVSGKEMAGVLMIALPYSKRELQEQERELLKGIGVIAGNLLALSMAAKDARYKAEERAIQAMVQGVPVDEVSDNALIAMRQEMQATLQLLREQNTELTRQIAQMQLDLDRERSRVAQELGETDEGMSVSQRLIAMNDEQGELRIERDRLLARLQAAETALAGATVRDNEGALKTLIESLQREKEDLSFQRDSLQAQLQELRPGEPFVHTPLMAQQYLDRLTEERTRLLTERDQFSTRLADIEQQLKAAGVEATAGGLSRLIASLTEQRAVLQTKVDSFELERNALLRERANVEDSIRREKERETRVSALQNEIKNLMSDREALSVERDQLRNERSELLALKETMKQQRARLLAEASGYQIELAESHQEQARLHNRLQQIEADRSELASQRDLLLAEKQALETQRDQLEATYQGNRERLQEISEEGVHSLTRMIDDLSQSRSTLEQELQDARSALALTQNQIDALSVRLDANNKVPEEVTSQTTVNTDNFLRMIQDLRTPTTSIMGYVDLLLDESAGILGEMQRKFLQRVAANVSRLEVMLEDLTHITALETDQYNLVIQPVDVVGLLEDAITSATYQFREKGLSVHLNLDDNVPTIQADRDAIGQIINQLLSNAYQASPAGTQIFISAHRQEVKLSQNANLASPTDCLLISVEDRGSGVLPEELSRVFKRKYRAENPEIKGLGDSGVGLSIARTLAEAHGGGLWVETRPEQGSIFYFALPISSKAPKSTRLEAAEQS
jgi:signal transduction histidine kinase